ncbi:MAG: hypothetical protein HY737_08510 [Candidatus Omnitrophica bacterium]|nr:hypothetical protein [Candidatus Omnitrophota bacterium]
MKTQHLTKLNAELSAAAPRLLPSLRVLRATAAPALGRSSEAGLVIEAQAPTGRVHRLWLDVRTEASPGRMAEAARRLKTAAATRGYPMIASRFLSARMRQLVREAGVGYLDLAGNCRVHIGDLYIEKVVDHNPFPRRGRPASLFTPISSRIVRAVLEEPKRLWQVQELASAADVSLGHASAVCHRLSDEAYAEWAQRRLRLRQPALLLDAWREQPAPAPAPQTLAYYSFERESARLMRRVSAAAARHHLRHAMTSFAAASVIAPFVRGVSAVCWYIDDALHADRWVRALDLRPVDAGANALMTIAPDAGVWYRAHAVRGVTVVGSVQLYLDLCAEPSRGREQAEFLRQKVLKY